MKGGNLEISRYKKYLSVALEEEFGFNIEEIEDILQSVELARIEAIARGADEDKTYEIIRKVVSSTIKRRIKQKGELCHVSIKNGVIVRENDVLSSVNDENELLNNIEINSFLNAYDRLNEKEKGIFMGRFVKGQMSREDVLEYTDVVYKVTEMIALENPELANVLYDKLTYMENPHK